MAGQRGSGSKPPLPSVIESFGKTESEREAALSDFGKQLDGVELVLDDEDEVDPLEQVRKSAGKAAASPAQAKPAQAKPAPAQPAPDRPNLEPVSDNAHKHRRLPTQPPAALELALDEPATRPASAPPESPATKPASGAGLPPPPTLAPRQSPAPVRRGLFSGDRITNMLGCAAVGLILMIYPAKQLARGYQAREVEPLISELQGAVEHPLGVEARLIEKPEAIAARIHEGRSKVRRRYMAIWLLAGLPIGLGLSFIRRD